MVKSVRDPGPYLPDIHGRLPKEIENRMQCTHVYAYVHFCMDMCIGCICMLVCISVCLLVHRLKYFQTLLHVCGWSSDQMTNTSVLKKEEKIRYSIVSHICLNCFSVYLSSIYGGIYISLSLTQEIACRVSVWNNELQTSSPMPLSMINELRLVSVDIFCITKNILTNISPFIIQGNAIGIDNK